MAREPRPPDGAGRRGVRIAEVLEASTAARARLRPDDVLVELDAQPVDDADAVASAARGARAGSLVTFRVERAGRTLEAVAEAAPMPTETVPGGAIELGEVEIGGRRLRTIVAVPDGPGPHAAVVHLPGVRTRSCEFPLAPVHPTARLVRTWVQAGLLVVRAERSGVGDSEGLPPPLTGLGDELDACDAATEAAFTRADVDPSAVFLFGHSLGGVLAPIVASGRPVAGLIAFGAPSARWHDAVVAASRSRLRLADPGDARARQQHALWTEMHRLAAREGWTPARAFEERPHLRALRSPDCDGETLYGRHVSFVRQLDAIDPLAAWRVVGAEHRPVLAVHGEHDVVVAAEDAAAIAAAAGVRGTWRQLERIGHDLLVHDGPRAAWHDPAEGRWTGSVADETIRWMRALAPPRRER